MPNDPLERQASSAEAARAFIDELRAKNEAFYRDDRGRGALNTLQQTFQKWHYVAELLQNAIDEQAHHIRIVINGGNLVFEHDGRSFTPSNVRGWPRSSI